jgi:hypothetical protein
MQPIDQMAFMVGLPKINDGPCGTRTVVQMAGNIIQRICAVNFGLSCAKKIEIWSVQNKDYRLVSQSIFPR